jgi:hypothetical protein
MLFQSRFARHIDQPMDLDPEGLKQTFAETWAEWVKEGKAGAMQIGFPAEVMDRVNTLGPPSWGLN